MREGRRRATGDTRGDREFHVYAMLMGTHCLHACRDETTVLAFNGLGKVLKANMATVLGIQGFDEKWNEICSIATKALCCGRKSVAVAAAQLLTGFLQVWLCSLRPVQRQYGACSANRAVAFAYVQYRMLSKCAIPHAIKGQGSFLIGMPGSAGCCWAWPEPRHGQPDTQQIVSMPQPSAGLQS